MTLVKWLWRMIQATALTLGTLYLGMKWVQNEFKVIAQDEVSQVEKRFERVRSADMEHLDKRFDKVERLIMERR
jgi:hypothetical protein